VALERFGYLSQDDNGLASISEPQPFNEVPSCLSALP
jgi:hypothetical protein